MPHLARTGRVDMRLLESQPPSDLHEVHAMLAAGLRDLDVKLQLVERAFYQQQDVAGGSSHRDPAELEVSRSAAAIRPMLSAAGLMAFLSLDQVSDAAHRRDMDVDIIVQLQQQQHPPPPPLQRVATASKSENALNISTAKEVKSRSKVSNTATEEDPTSDADEPREQAVEHPYDVGDPEPTKKITDHESRPSATVAPSVQMETSSPPKTVTAVADVVDDAVFALSRTLRDCVRKVLDAVPSSFDDVVADLRRIQRSLTKYCISFYGDVAGEEGNVSSTSSGTQKPHQNVRLSRSSSSLLGTAATYDLQIRMRQSAINAHISSVRDLVERFRSTELRLVDLGADGADLARRAGAAHAPFLLLFPVSCRRLRAAADEMRSWLADDASYADFVANDVAELELRVKSIDGRLRVAREDYHRAVFKARAASDECQRITAALERTRGREEQLIVDEELLSAEASELKSEADTTEYRRMEMTRNARYYTPEMMHAKYNELCEQLRDIKVRLPVAEASLKDIRQKLAKLNEKRLLLKSERKRLASLESERDEASNRAAELEIERDSCAVALDSVRQILAFKRSPDVIRKLFNDRPAHVTNAQRLPGNGTRQDDFDRLCRFVADTVSNDWPSLYRTLPFNPSRGVATVDRDVTDIGSSRDPASVLADRALSRWRRYHTTACPGDLVAALRRLGRGVELVRRVEAEMSRTGAKKRPTNTSADEVPPSADVPEWLGADLLPYWREVERFDEITATRKLQMTTADGSGINGGGHY